MQETEFYWKHYRWRVGQPWGITHQDKKNNWYSPTSVDIKSVKIKDKIYDDVLVLDVVRESRTFNGVVKPYSVGLVSCIDLLSYGTWTWRAKLPSGTNLWPSLWTCANNSWPPEIDMLEGYTYPKKTNYIRNIFETYLETNIHYSKSETDKDHQHLKAKGVPTWMYLLYRNKSGVDEYKFEWTPEYVKFYFNGHCFRTVKDKEVLKSLNNHPMHYPIMNMQINSNYSSDDHMTDHKLYVIDFKYFPLDANKLN